MADWEDYVAALAWRLAHAWPLSGAGTRSLRFLEEHGGDGLLREAAAEVVRLRLRPAGHFQDVSDRRLLCPRQKPSLRPSLPVATDDGMAVLMLQQRMQATQLHYLEQWRRVAWETQGKARGSRLLCQWTPRLPPPQQQQPVRPGTGIYRSVAKRSSAGTGVFLPRTRPASKAEPQRSSDGQRNAMVTLQKSKSSPAQRTSIVSWETHLPHEWTY